MPICARYGRVSTDKLSQKDSIEHQIALMEEYAKRMTQTSENDEIWDTPEELVYTDEDYSGFKMSLFDRPAMSRLVRDAKAGKFDTVMFKGISRIVRDTQEALELLSIFEALNIRVISYEENYDSSKSDRFIFTIHSALSEQESTKISVRVSLGNKQKARTGRWTGSTPPFGYSVDKETKRLTPGNPQHVDTVKLIFDLYVNENQGTFNIAKHLNARGWLTSNNNLWSRRTVRQILMNRAYVGDIVYGKTRNKVVRDLEKGGKKQKSIPINEEDWSVCLNAHTPLIERAVFNHAQATLKSRAIGQTKKRLVHPLSSILKCGVCGEGMVCQKRSSQWGDYRYYICKTYHKYGREACPQANIRADDIEKFVYEFLLDQIKEYQTNGMSERVEFGDQSRQELVEQLKVCEREIEKLNKDTLDLFKMRNQFTPDQYTYANDGLKKELKFHTEKRDLIEQKLASMETIDSKKQLEDAMAEFLQVESDDQESLRKYFHLLLNEVVVSDYVDIKTHFKMTP